MLSLKTKKAEPPTQTRVFPDSRKAKGTGFKTILLRIVDDSVKRNFSTREDAAREEQMKLLEAQNEALREDNTLYLLAFCVAPTVGVLYQKK